MALTDDFDAAVARVKTLKQTPPPADLLELYALYKQATLGDVSGDRPGMLDFKGRAKFDAWNAKRGTAKDAAMQAYIRIVTSLEQRFS